MTTSSRAVGVDLTDSTVTVADRLTAAVADLVEPESVVAIVSPLTRLLGTTWPEESFVDREADQERCGRGRRARRGNCRQAADGAVRSGSAWVDPSTLGLLRRLRRCISARAIVVNYRPGILLGIGEERIVVADPTEDQVATMLRNLLDGDAVGLPRQRRRRTRGRNPFFVEELAHHLHEAGSVIVENERFAAIRSAAEDGGIP